jgi:uncharacterized protein (TIGR00296 family)
LAPLAEAVPRMMVAAARNDPRHFWSGPVPEHGEIEISVLTPMKRIRDPAALRLGRHGVHIESGAGQGFLLPQVARGYGWDRARFMETLCRKAGLPPEAWRDPQTRLYLFQAEVFARACGAGLTSPPAGA